MSTSYPNEPTYAAAADEYEPSPADRAQAQGIGEELALAGRSHLMAYTQLTRRGYKPKEFHWQIADALMAVMYGEVSRQMIFIPPRYGKTELVSVRFPPYYMAHSLTQADESGLMPGNPLYDPTPRNVISVSYNAELAEEFGGKARDVAESPQHAAIFPLTGVMQGTRAKNRWLLSRAGGGPGVFAAYVGAGVGGPLTGRGAHLFLVDDPIKNRQEADSDTFRKIVKDFYTSVAYTRLEEDGAIVIVQTRWHEDDLSGWLLEEMKAGGDEWEVLSLPVYTDETKTEVLWPEKYPLKSVKRTERVLPERDFSALYMQSPSVGGGNIFKSEWWKRYDRLPDPYDGFHPEVEAGGSPLLRTGRFAPFQPDKPALRGVSHYVDSAFKEGVLNDFSVIATWGIDELGRYYLVDIVRERVAYNALMLLIHRQVAKWRHRFPYEQPVVIEDKASGQSAIQTLSVPYYTSRGKLPALSVIAWPVLAGASKTSRAEGVSPIVQAGRCLLPAKAIRDKEGSDLIQLFIKEHSQFPAGRFDDMVDTTSMALERMRQGGSQDPESVLALAVRAGRRGAPMWGTTASGLLVPETAYPEGRTEPLRTGNTLWGRGAF